MHKLVRQQMNEAGWGCSTADKKPEHRITKKGVKGISQRIFPPHERRGDSMEHLENSRLWIQAS